jgi:membrane protein YqaA with SNARE-associated domain
MDTYHIDYPLYSLLQRPKKKEKEEKKKNTHTKSVIIVALLSAGLSI